MKKILFSSMLFIGFFAQISIAQTYTTPLYIIFDIDTPPMTRDSRKYEMMRGETQPIIRTYEVGHAYPDIYHFGLPLHGSGTLVLSKKRNTTISEIPLSEVATLYPQAKTILQVEQEVMPLIEQDFCCPSNQFVVNYGTYKYFSDTRPIYVIELDKPNNRAIIVFVEGRSHY